MPKPGAKSERKFVMRALSTLPVLVALAIGCSRQSPEAPSTPATGVASAAIAATAAAAAPAGAASSAAAAASPAAVARTVKEENELYDFEYSYPAAAGVMPALKAALDGELAKRKAELVANAREQRASSGKDDVPYRALGSWTEWQVVADLPGWLSLSASVGSYEGGAHPNHWFDTLLWDKRANRRRGPTELFASKEALSRAIRKDFCAALNRQRARKRGEPVSPGSTDEFDRCVDPVDSTVILGSSNGRAFDRIGVLVPPYEAGPYAEGDYEVTLPVTAAVMAAVRPEYRTTFVVKR
jgi:hypothetical protein